MRRFAGFTRRKDNDFSEIIGAKRVAPEDGVVRVRLAAVITARRRNDPVQRNGDATGSTLDAEPKCETLEHTSRLTCNPGASVKLFERKVLMRLLSMTAALAVLAVGCSSDGSTEKHASGGSSGTRGTITGGAGGTNPGRTNAGGSNAGG